jgi:hypothetical protein
MLGRPTAPPPVRGVRTANTVPKPLLRLVSAPWSSSRDRELCAFHSEHVYPLLRRLSFILCYTRSPTHRVDNEGL